MCRVVEIYCYSTLLQKVYALYPNLYELELLHIIPLFLPFFLALTIGNFLEAVDTILLRGFIQLANNDLC